MDREIFKVKKLCEHSYFIDSIEPTIVHKKMSVKKCKVYQYKNLYLIIDENNGKECFRIENIDYKLSDDFVINSYKITTIMLTLFPFINKYDSILERVIETYNYKNKSYAYVTETDIKTNESIKYIKVSNYDDNEVMDLIMNVMS